MVGRSFPELHKGKVGCTVVRAAEFSPVQETASRLKSTKDCSRDQQRFDNCKTSVQRDVSVT